MSPTQTDYQEIEEQALYPAKPLSTRVINQSLFNPWVVITGGNVWVAGAIIAIMVFFGAGVARSHHDFTNAVINELVSIRPWLHLNKHPLPHLPVIPQALSEATSLIKPALLMLITILAIGIAGLYAKWLFERLTRTYDWGRDRLLNLQLQRNRKTDPKVQKQKEDLYTDYLSEIEGQTSRVHASKLVPFWLTSLLCLAVTVLLWRFAENTPLFIILVVLQGGLMAWVYFLSLAKFRKFQSRSRRFDGETASRPPDKPGEMEELADQVRLVSELAVTNFSDYLPFWGLVTIAAGNALMTFQKYSVWNKHPVVPNFSFSVLVLLAIVGASVAVIVSTYYSKWLFDQSYRIKVTPISYGPATFLSAGAVFFLGVALWVFARNQGRLIIEDVIYLLPLVAVPVGCICLALVKGNHVPTWPRRAMFFFLGAWHGFLQLAVPFLLLWVGGWWAGAVALATVAVFTSIPIVLVRRLRLRWLGLFISKVFLTGLWVIYGAWMFLIPIIWPRDNPGIIVIGDWGKLSLLVNLVVVGAVGALMSCVWLGWYFAVSLVFDGHANEAGSTARTEDYKQFIRFRLTEETLTGFVIGIDFPHAPTAKEPHRDGSTLKPRLIDVFTLKCGPPAEPDNKAVPNDAASAVSSDVISNSFREGTDRR